MVMSGRLFVCLMGCFTSTVNSYGHVGTVLCLFGVLLYVHGKQLRPCLDSHLFIGMLLYVHGKQLRPCLDSHLFIGVLLYVHGKQLRPCLDGHLFI